MAYVKGRFKTESNVWGVECENVLSASLFNGTLIPFRFHPSK